MTAKDLIISALVDLYQNGPEDRYLGICNHIGEYVSGETEDLTQAEEARICQAVRDLRDDLFCRWPLRSGDFAYPVPGAEGVRPNYAFNHTDDLWSGEYGERRWALAEFMLRELCK